MAVFKFHNDNTMFVWRELSCVKGCLLAWLPNLQAIQSSRFIWQEIQQYLAENNPDILIQSLRSVLYRVFTVLDEVV